MPVLNTGDPVIPDRQRLIDLLATATTALCDLDGGVTPRDIATSSGRLGLHKLAVELASLLKAAGFDDEHSWDSVLADENPAEGPLRDETGDLFMGLPDF